MNPQFTYIDFPEGHKWGMTPNGNKVSGKYAWQALNPFNSAPRNLKDDGIEQLIEDLHSITGPSSAKSPKPFPNVTFNFFSKIDSWSLDGSSDTKTYEGPGQFIVFTVHPEDPTQTPKTLTLAVNEVAKFGDFDGSPGLKMMLEAYLPKG
jgi:hypothetical protein